MRIYWLNGSLMIQPESGRESALLAELSTNVRFEPPDDETVSSGQMGLTDLGLKVLIGANQPGPRGLPGETGDQQPIVGIDKTAKVIPYLHRVPRRP